MIFKSVHKYCTFIYGGGGVQPPHPLEYSQEVQGTQHPSPAEDYGACPRGRRKGLAAGQLWLLGCLEIPDLDESLFHGLI